MCVLAEHKETAKKKPQTCTACFNHQYKYANKPLTLVSSISFAIIGLAEHVLLLVLIQHGTVTGFHIPVRVTSRILG